MVLGTEIAHNFHLHAYSIPTKVQGMDVLHGNSLTQTLSGLPSDTFNIIYISNGNRLTLPEMKEVLNRYNGQPFTVWVNESENIKKVRAIIKTTGLKEVNQLPGMLLELDNYTPESTIRGTIRKAENEEDLKSAGHILSLNWTQEDKSVRDYFSRAGEAILGSTEVCYYLYLENETPIGVVEVFPSSSETVGIYNLSVLQEYRGKGIATALLQHVLNNFKDESYKYAILQAEEEARTIYERLGFRTLTFFHEYQ